MMRRPSALRAFALALIAVGAGFAMRQDAGAAGDLITGRWHIELSPSIAGTCEAVFIRDGTQLHTDSYCGVIGSVTLDGTVDDSGHFQQTGTYDVVIEGTVSGESMSGTFDGLGIQGTLSGTRLTKDTSPVDRSGAWLFVFQRTDGPDQICDADITQSDVLIDVVIVCPDETTSWSGSVQPLTGTIALELLPDRLGRIRAEPSVGAYNALLGFWEADGSGPFYAFRPGAPKGGIVALECVTPHCDAGPGEDIEVMVYLVLPPTGGYDAYQVSVRANFLSQLHSFRGISVEADACRSPINSAGNVGTTFFVTVMCNDSRVADQDGTLAKITFACPDERVARAFDLDWDGTWLRRGATYANRLLSGGAGVLCTGPTLPREAYDQANVDCSDDIDAIDAAIVLQLDAGVLHALPCKVAGDTNLDGRTDSADAAVILQIVGRLVSPELT